MHLYEMDLATVTHALVTSIATCNELGLGLLLKAVSKLQSVECSYRILSGLMWPAFTADGVMR